MGGWLEPGGTSHTIPLYVVITPPVAVRVDDLLELFPTFITEAGG
jgi:hypothetical protein